IRMEATVQKLEPESYFSYTWHPYAIEPGVDYSKETPTLVEFTLEDKGGETLLTVTESGFAKLPPHRRDEAFRMDDKGWSAQLTNIEEHVALAS
ncbi:MAG TPA: SRPBCC family protein, partial [Chthoniobacterales bacterium]|nr:SRPBCC family protein [Chthoniobacterales bacterium]